MAIKIKPPETKPYDAAEFLTDDETIAAYLTEAREGDAPRSIAKALSAVARARCGLARRRFRASPSPR